MEVRLSRSDLCFPPNLALGLCAPARTCRETPEQRRLQPEPLPRFLSPPQPRGDGPVEVFMVHLGDFTHPLSLTLRRIW